MNPGLRKTAWLAVYLAVVLTPLAVLILAPTPPGGGFWWDVSMGLGYAGLTMMGIQFLLTARFRRATAPWGIDVVYAFHRYVAYVLLFLLALHPLLLVLLNPAHLSALLTPWAVGWEIGTGTAALALLLLLVGASAWRKRLRIPYEAWRVSHLLLSLAAMGLAFAHLAGVGFYTGSAYVRLLWGLIALSLLTVVLRVRLLRPWRLTHRPWRLREVRRERGDCWNLVVQPEGHEGFSFEPGQFAWVTFGSSPFLMREHPFSFSSAPDPGGSLEFTIKELGDFTRTVGGLPPGTLIHVDGPYGAFSVDRRPGAPGYVFIAGGIGIAPVVSMLRALAERGDRRPHLCVAAHGSWERVPLRDELDALRRRLRLTVVHVLEEPPEAWEGEVGRVSPELLDRHLPAERKSLVYYLCGPVPMIRATERALEALGIPRAQVHTELFDLV